MPGATAATAGAKGTFGAVRGSLLPRSLHPVAWWLWALGLATAATRTTNPILLATILAVAGLVVAARRGSAPWARAFRVYLILGLVVIAVRIVFRMVLGAAPEGSDGHLLFRLPSVGLPDWMAGIHLGGRIEAEDVLAAAYDGLRLATMLCCVGAANALADPKRALRSLPGALYEIGVAVVVALTVAPQMIESGQRVLPARRLRGESGGRYRLLHRLVLPVLQDALARSLALAAAMESRGYGRTRPAAARIRHTSAGLVVAGLIALAVGGYGVLNSAGGSYGLPALLVGVGCCCAGLYLGGRRQVRTRYRPDRWQLPEWVAAVSGALAAAGCFAPGIGTVLNPPTSPLTWPTVAVLPLLGVLLAALPAVLTPTPPAMPTGPGRPAAVDRDHRRTATPAVSR